MIRHTLRALLLSWFYCWLIRGQAKCSLHQLENVREYGQETITKEINFDDIIRELLNKICLTGGSSLELATAKHLQQQGLEGKFLLQLQWIAGQLLVYANGSD